MAGVQRTHARAAPAPSEDAPWARPSGQVAERLDRSTLLLGGAGKAKPIANSARVGNRRIFIV
jgi:hypothetical protein